MKSLVIYEFLTGNKSYYNVYVLKENYLEKNNELFKPILDSNMKVIHNIIISDEEIIYINANINC
ncbi:hypothetical protein [Clostridium beijerinckii]|uniref:hypothetical protein n=1 Tax=Clostridium beijerinckii TaxID=1520 RepID=UPI001494FAC4|nr:hypothetical protein [Clostridium beijerinckii]NOW06120.1 hypothetical protein [Clostridium beijerinckii]